MSPVARPGPGEAEPAPLTGAHVLSRYAEAHPWHGLAKSRLFHDRIAAELFGTETEIASEFYSFAGLLELAVSAGYVDLGAWDKTDALAEVVQTFLARESASEAPADLGLLHALALRLQEKRYRVDALHTPDFNAFASLLALECAVRNDVHTRTFIEKCEWGEWHSDLAFLVTPEQFAARLAEELHHESAAGAIRGGLGTLKAFVFFGEILDRVAKNEALAEGFVRGLRWVQQVGSVRERISVWAERMIEWAVSSGDDLGEVKWQEVSGRLLDIEQRVAKIRPTPPKLPAITREIEDAIDGMISEGRVGGALRLVRDEAERRATRLEQAVGKPEAPQHAQKLLDACKRLDELGDASRAAAVLAPQMERLRVHLHEIHLNDATAILARARSVATTPQTPPQEQLWSSPRKVSNEITPPLKSKPASRGGA